MTSKMTKDTNSRFEAVPPLSELNDGDAAAACDAVPEYCDDVPSCADVEDCAAAQESCVPDDFFDDAPASEPEHEESLAVKSADSDGFVVEKADLTVPTLLEASAGTGKTFLMKGVVDYLSAVNRSVHLMAPTGRAAKVLSTRTSRSASTIHAHLYSPRDRDDPDDEDFTLVSDLTSNTDELDAVYVVDEASMVSDRETQNPLLQFGSGRLLADLLHFLEDAPCAHRRHILFVGDAAQLPPVGMTVSPVISCVADNYWRNRGKQPMQEYEATVRKVIRAFAKEKRIVFWDLWNEPRYEDKAETYEQMDILEQMVQWCRDENPIQPLTSSIIWATIKRNSKSLKRMAEVESMMDIHNFHYYNCALNFSKNINDMMDYLQEIGSRPMVATECLTRTNGSGIARTFAAFSKYKVNFYIWGLYINDCNWEARWGRSTYDPYGPMFHNILYSDRNGL